MFSQLKIMLKIHTEYTYTVVQICTQDDLQSNYCRQVFFEHNLPYIHSSTKGFRH